jgi:hypothetical protein
MADEKIIFKVVVDDDGNIVKLKSTQKGFQDIDLTVKNAEKSAQKLNETIGKTGSGARLKSINVTRKEYEKLAKTQSQVKNATGAATSATLELGRAISDAPYGIRGVANNLSQFASQFSFMSNKVDEATGKVVGFNGALKNLIKGIRANAVLLTIQIIISAFEKMAMSQKKTAEETSSLSKTFGTQTTKLMVLKSALDDSNISLEDKTELVKKANNEFKDLNIELDDNGNLTDASRIAIDKHSIALVKNAKAKALASLITKEMNNQAKIEAEEAGDQLNFLETLFGAISAKVIGTSAAVSNAIETDTEKRDKLLEKSEKRVNKFLKMFKEDGADLAKSLLGEDSGDIFEGKFIESYYNEIAGLEDVVKDEDFDGISDTAKITGTIILKPKIDNPDPEDLEDLTFYLDKYKQLMSGVSDFLQGETDRQLTIEQNKTNVLNKELNDRLLNENLSKDERAKIQNQIAINDEELRKKQNKIKKKAFDTQKAFNISIAVADTIAAGINASKQTYGGAFAKIAAMTAVIGAGMAQVAVIARQKFQPEAASTPINTTTGGGASGGTSERAEPSFNIVGRSNDNLLINAIQAQFGKPLKAYVVSRDVTTQQQLDGMIVGQAGT